MNTQSKYGHLSVLDQYCLARPADRPRRIGPHSALLHPVRDRPFDIGSDDDTVSEASYSREDRDDRPLPVSPMVSAVGGESVAGNVREMSLDSSSESSDKFHTPENGSGSDDEEDVKTAKS